MSNMPMIHPLTDDTVKQYATNAGLLCADVDISAATDAASLMDIIKAASDKWLGATSGTTDIDEGRRDWMADHNGIRMPAKGMRHLDTAEPYIKAKLVQINAQNMKLASGAADVEGEGTNVEHVKPRAYFEEDDYHDIIWLTNLGADGVVVAILRNAICVTGMKWTIDDKKVATCDVDFRGHVEKLTDNVYLPIEYYLYKAA